MSPDHVALLPAPRPPFMVKDTFVVKADLFPLGSTYNGHRESRHFEVDADIERYIHAKLDSLRHAPHLHHVTDTDDPAGLAEALGRVFRAYADEWPEVLVMVESDVVDLNLLGIRVDGRSVRSDPVIERLPGLTPLGAAVADHLDGVAGLTRLADALGLCCQEDLVIMRGLPEGGDIAEWLHVCIPSGWDPATRPSAPELHGLTPAEVAALTFLRMERQTTLAMPDLDRALFTVRIYLDPLVDRLASEPSLGPRLASLIASCSPEVIAYKGMSDIAAPVMQWLTYESP